MVLDFNVNVNDLIARGEYCLDEGWAEKNLPSMYAGLYNEIPDDRKKAFATLVWRQLILNYHYGKDARFVRGSIPLLYRLMTYVPELTCEYRGKAQVRRTELFGGKTYEEMHNLLMDHNDLDEERDRNKIQAIEIARDIKHLMNLEDKTTIIFLGLILDHDGNFLYYYSWE